jgi:hypothetical protein
LLNQSRDRPNGLKLMGRRFVGKRFGAASFGKLDWSQLRVDGGLEASHNFAGALAHFFDAAAPMLVGNFHALLAIEFMAGHIAAIEHFPVGDGMDGLGQDFGGGCILGRVLHQARVSSAAGSSIEFSALVKDLMEQGGAQMFVAVHFSPSSHQHVGGHGQPAETLLGALVAPDGALAAAWHNDHQIHIAVFGGRAPSVRTKQPDLLGLKFSFQSFDRLFQKAGLNGLHRAETSNKAADLKTGV